MSTKRGTILTAVATLLAATDGIAGRSFRSRSSAIAREETPCIVVRPETEDSSDAVHNQVDKKLNIKVEVFTRGDEPEVLSDPIIEDAHARIMADTTLGGLAIDITEISTVWEEDDADAQAGIATVTYQVWYRHQRNNLAS